MPITKRRPRAWSRAPKDLVDDLKSFQKRRGIQADGKPGCQTVEEFLLHNAQLEADLRICHQPDDPGVETLPDDRTEPKPRNRVRAVAMFLVVLAVLCVLVAGIYQ